MNVTGLFAGIENAQVGYGGNYLTHGQYLIRIDDVKLKEKRNGGEMVIVEGTVVHAYRDGNGKLPSEDGYQGHNVGDVVSECIQRGDYFLKEVKQFIMAATGVASELITPKETMEIVGYDEAGNYVGNEPLNGRFFTMECNNPLVASRTKKNDDGTPKEYPRVNWVRRVPSTEVKTQISQNAQDRFYMVDGASMLDLLISQGL